ncbi:hypothetical protein C1I92_04925 [Jiangella anatolica]|uniref:Uncharacterized protein n=1 Tax=Jiangella anatolica TaxID=2670374 RepID=A0A2W2C024_9ACTN|nr:hypothetical protein C1I92_04925 [Jiangella anatolica]
MVGAGVVAAVLVMVGSWAPTGSGWDGYDPAGPSIEPTAPSLPVGQAVSPECRDEHEAALRDAERTGATLVAYLCERDRPPPEECEPGEDVAHVRIPELPGEYVTLDCRG